MLMADGVFMLRQTQDGTNRILENESLRPHPLDFERSVAFDRDKAEYSISLCKNHASLSPEGLLLLTRELFPLYMAGFLHSGTDYSDADYLQFFDDLYAHLAQSKRLTVVRQNQEIACFIASDLLSSDCGQIYHLQGIVVAPSFQGKGLAEAVLEKELNQCSATLLAFHTQSLRMLRVGLKLSEFEHALVEQIAQLIHTRHPQDGVDKHRYGDHALYGDLQRFKNEAIPDIDIAHGDALIFVGRIHGKQSVS